MDQGDTIFYLQPSSITEGIEFETTAVLVPGVNLYLNGTVDNAYYEGSLNANTTSTSQTNPVYEQAPSGLWVAQTPTDTEMEGLTYREERLRSWTSSTSGLAMNGWTTASITTRQIIPQFSTLGAYLNYTVRNHSLFDQTKIRLSGTNLLDAHYVQSNSLAGSPNLIYLNGGGTCTTPTASNPCDAFRTAGPTPINGQRHAQPDGRPQLFGFGNVRVCAGNEEINVRSVTSI